MLTLGEFAAHMAKLAALAEADRHLALGAAARMIEAEAKAEIGTYQGAAGPFAAWEQLADVTQADRVAKGFTANDPLLRTGELRDSIEHHVGATEADVGSNSDVAVWQELGTPTIPPRSFLGGAAFRKGHEAAALVGATVLTPLMAGK